MERTGVEKIGVATLAIALDCGRWRTCIARAAIESGVEVQPSISNRSIHSPMLISAIMRC